MTAIKIIAVVLLSVMVSYFTKAQQPDTSQRFSLRPGSNLLRTDYQTVRRKPFPGKTLLIPAVLITYGITSIEQQDLKTLNVEIREELYEEGPHKKFPADNFLQFAPAAAVFGLNAMGIKGKHNLRDRSMIYLMSNAILMATVFSVKQFSHQLRPDGSDNFSFPSGHTAEAFASAEFMRQEYKDVSPWYGVAGYAMAATTGYLRMYNNKHWLSDVAAGAGIGIASTRIAYWLYPKIQKKLFGDKPVSTVVVPSYQSGVLSIGMVHRF